MRQRSPKTGTPLNQKQQELARRESKLREEMQKLERMIAEAPRIAEEANRRNREELIVARQRRTRSPGCVHGAAGQALQRRRRL